MAKSPETPAAGKQPPVYEITSTQDAMSVAPNGRVIAVKQIYFRTAFGDAGHVEIPKEQFDADRVRKMIEDEIDELLKLRGF